MSIATFTASGKDFRIVSLHIAKTYEGLLLGVPDTNPRYLTQWAPRYDSGAFYVLPHEEVDLQHPIRKNCVRYPKHAIQVSLDGKALEGRENDKCCPNGPDFSYANVLWLVEELPDNPVKAFIKVAQEAGLPWAEFAVNGCF